MDNPQPGFDAELFKAYMRFNEEMHQAGVLVASEGLNPEAKGARIAVANGKRYVVDGPFAESKELEGGFYIIEVDSLDEAIQWKSWFVSVKDHRIEYIKLIGYICSDYRTLFL